MYTSFAHCQLPLPPMAQRAAVTPHHSRMPSESSSSRTVVASYAGSTQRAATTTTTSNGDGLPPYSLDTELPRYTRVPEVVVILPVPPTITMYLFMGGFCAFLVRSSRMHDLSTLYL